MSEKDTSVYCGRVVNHNDWTLEAAVSTVLKGDTKSEMACRIILEVGDNPKTHIDASLSDLADILNALLGAKRDLEWLTTRAGAKPDAGSVR